MEACRVDGPSERRYRGWNGSVLVKYITGNRRCSRTPINMVTAAEMHFLFRGLGRVSVEEEECVVSYVQFILL